MIVIEFGRWSEKGTRFLRHTRIYAKGYKWTPFCRVTKRNNKMFKRR